MKQAMNAEAARKQAQINLEIHENSYAELMRERREKLELNAAYAKRGSKFYPDGITPIKRNANIDVRIVDPRTPKSISNPAFTELRGINTNEPELSDTVWKAIVKSGLTSGLDFSKELNTTTLYEQPRYLQVVDGKIGPTLTGNIGLVHDGIPEPSKWASHPVMKTYGQKENWIELDLGAEYFITNITLWGYYSTANRIYYNQKLELSLDRAYKNEDVVWSVAEGPVETPEGNTIVLNPPVRGRYVRNWRGHNNGGGSALFIEVAIHGYSAVPLAPPPTNKTQEGSTTVEEIDNIQQPGSFCKNPCDCLTSLKKDLKSMCGDVCKQNDLLSILQCSELKRKGKALEKDMAAIEIMKAEELQPNQTSVGTVRIKKAHPMGGDQGKPMFNMF